MAEMTEVHDELYVLARRVLLDALDALHDHLDALVLVGAQAVYLRVGDADLAVAPYTTDGDLAIDPRVLTDIPPLETALTTAGFRRKNVGIWVTTLRTASTTDTVVEIDLLVPGSVSPGTGRRAANLPGHSGDAARTVKSGLDGVLVDADMMRISSLHATDARTFDVRVAGAAALLVAKLHKIEDRQQGIRSVDKDALDVLRLLRGTDTSELAARYAKLLSSGESRASAVHGRDLLEAQFIAAGGIGIEMAVRAVGRLADADEIEASCRTLAGDLLALIAADNG